MSTSDRPSPTAPSPDRPPVSIHRIPKPGGGFRQLVRLDPLDADQYRAAISPMVPAIERALGNQVVANRVRPTSRGYRLEDWRRARRRFDAVAHAGVRTANAVFVGDVRDCYASIRPGTVEHSLRSVGIDADVARRAMSVLDDLERRGVRGLPVGPWGSGVLANAVLHGLDRALASEGLEALRWVDDVVVFASSASAANRADEVFRRSLATLGLEPNESKTHMLDPEAARARFIGDRISRADGGRRGMMRPP